MIGLSNVLSTYRNITSKYTVFTFRSYNTNFSNQLSPFVRMPSNQTSQELKTMCKTHLKIDIFCSKNITFPNGMMTNHIF